MDIINVADVPELHVHHHVTIMHDGEQHQLKLKSIGGKVQGDAQSGVWVAYGKYFQIDITLRQQHFDMIKDHIEDTFSLYVSHE